MNEVAETQQVLAEPVGKKKYRLLARAFMDGAVREAGHIFTLAEGELGPHKTVSHGPDIVHQEGDRDADREVAKAKDIPLYEEVQEEPEVPIEERHKRELSDFTKKIDAEYRSILARHEQELGGAKDATTAHESENPAPEPPPPNGPSDEPERARSIADSDWATRPEHGASAADANWPGAKTADTGHRPLNRPFMQSGPGHDPNVPQG